MASGDMASEPPTLSHASNAMIFAQLATPQVVDHGKLEQLQARNHVGGLSLNRTPGASRAGEGNVSVVVRPPQRYRPPSDDDDNDSVGDIVRDALTRPPQMTFEDDDARSRASRRSTPHFEDAVAAASSRSPSHHSGDDDDDDGRSGYSKSGPARRSGRMSGRSSGRRSGRSSEHSERSEYSEHGEHSSPRHDAQSSGSGGDDEENVIMSSAAAFCQRQRASGYPPAPPPPGARVTTPDDSTVFSAAALRRPSLPPHAPDTGNVFPRLPRVGDPDPHADRDPTLADLRARFSARVGGVGDALPAAAAAAPAAPTSYTDLLRQATRLRLGGSARRTMAPRDDPDYAEKSELMIRVDELRQLGFSIPQELDASWPVEELRSQIKRRTICISTVAYVNWYVDAICTFARGVEFINNLLGPFLPLQDYHKTIKEKTHTERFRYAMYQIVLRFHGRSAFNPWREILSVLVAPLATALALKVVELLARRKLGKAGARSVAGGLGGLLNGNGISTLLGMAGVGGGGVAPPGGGASGVPSGIDGITRSAAAAVPTAASSNLSPPPFGGASGSAFGSVPNPFSSSSDSSMPPPAPATAGAFGGDYPHVKDVPTAPSAPRFVPPPPPPPTAAAVGGASRRRRPRLMRPEEVMSDLAVGAPPGAVVTEEQLSALQSSTAA